MSEYVDALETRDTEIRELREELHVANAALKEGE